MSSNPGSASGASPRAQPRRPRKNRQLVVPADTLLTFTRYHPRADVDPAPPRPAKRTTAPRPREHFVQANYRFAVDPHHPSRYAECAALPDALIPWSAVDVVFMHQPHDCPICLHPLRCPRLTPCGHVFDFVCMLQHLSHSAADDGCAKCPLCSSRVCAQDLRACVFRDVAPLDVGLPCAMRLVSRERGSMLAHAHPTHSYAHIPDVVSSDIPFYSRFAVADENYLLQLITKSMQELRDTVREDASLTPFVAAAMNDLKAKKHAVRMRRSAARTIPISRTAHGVDLHIHEHRAPPSVKDLWYFYQATDARSVFLHPVNHRCLTTQLSGDFNQASTEIHGEVLQVERHTMDEQLRKRYRFLEHLPDGCEFSFVELNLSHMLSSKTLAAHHGELKERSSARKRKEIATAKEDKLLERKRSESLQQYFNTQGGRVASNVQHRESVDSRDVNSFPALRVDLSPHAEHAHEDSESTTETQLSGVSPSPPGGAWGAEVSSYSSVTSNMGLFPALGQTAPLASSPQSPGVLQGAWGSSNAPNSSQTPSSSQTPTPSRNGSSPPEETKRGKKSHGKTTILLSNAGSPYRR